MRIRLKNAFTPSINPDTVLVGIELMHMLRKGQLKGDELEDLTAAEQFSP